MNPYVVFLLYLMAILGFVATTLLLNRLLGPKPAPNEIKLEPFECGATPVDPLNVKAVPIKYYAVAVVFIPPARSDSSMATDPTERSSAFSPTVNPRAFLPFPAMVASPRPWGNPLCFLLSLPSLRQGWLKHLHSIPLHRDNVPL